MYEFCYDHVKQLYGEKVELCYMDAETFIVYIKTDDIYKDIAEDVQTWLDTSDYELDRPFHKHDLGEVIMKEFALRVKIYSYVSDNNNEDKKARSKKKCVIKMKLKFGDCKHCLKQLNLKKKKKTFKNIFDADNP